MTAFAHTRIKEVQAGNWKDGAIRKLEDESNDARDLWLAAIWGHIPLLEIEVVKNKPPHHGIQRLEITVMEVGNGRNNWPPSSPDHRNQDLNGRVTHQGPLSPATAHIAGIRGGDHTPIPASRYAAAA